MPAAVPASSSLRRASRTGLAVGLVLLLSVALLAVAGPADARRTPAERRAHAAAVAHKAAVVKARKVAHRKAVRTAKRVKAQRAQLRRAQVRRAKILRQRLARARAHRARVLGVPKGRYVVPPSTYFSFPNRSKAERMAIRNRVLATVKSTWGGRRNSLGMPLPTNGTIRMASWSFDDWDMAKALVAARDRGASVQLVAAADANGDHGPWRYLRKHLGSRLYKPGHPETREVASYARQCRGSCRGYGGTPHAKYFLFNNVGPRHVKNVVVQTSMNLTTFAYDNQWNHAQVMWSSMIYRDFLSVFRQMRLGVPARPNPYHVFASGNVVDIFFPRPGANAAGDPVMQILNKVNCSGSTAAGHQPWAHQDPDHAVRHLRRARHLDRQEAALPLGARLRRRHHLLAQQRAGDVDPAEQLRPRQDPDAPVGDQGPLGHHREVQPQQVDDDHRHLGGRPRRGDHLRRLGQLGQPGPGLRRADAAHLQHPGRGALQRGVQQDLEAAVLDARRPSVGSSPVAG